MSDSIIGVILLNMGGPSKLEDVRPFLYNLFSDREIIRLGPPFLQKPIAWYIAKKRAPKSMETYRKIGGGSPIAAITEQQRQALQTELASHGRFIVTTAMRYWQPYTSQALEPIISAGVQTVIALSLYPHFSCATTGSSLNELKRHLNGKNIELKEIPSWPDHPGYLQVLANKINEGLARFQGDDVELVYSAHSLPVSFIEGGDPYVRHLEKTIVGVEKLTGKKGRICYQSRSGPVEWLSPSTPEMIDAIADEKGKNILMVPISFVSDHVETLYEINIQYREQAAEKGIRLEATESLNTDPVFIKSLKELVLDAL